MLKVEIRLVTRLTILPTSERMLNVKAVQLSNNPGERMNCGGDGEDGFQSGQGV